jgi:hypothetical protein
MKEEEGDLQEAARILQELQVETYGSMERKEKVIHQSTSISFCGSGNTGNTSVVDPHRFSMRISRIQLFVSMRIRIQGTKQCGSGSRSWSDFKVTHFFCLHSWGLHGDVFCI